MTNECINFTKKTLSTLPKPPKGKRTYYKDSQVKGLVVMVTANGSLSFYLRKKIKCVTERFYLGSYPDLTIENARKNCTLKLAEIANGIDPKEEKMRLRQEMTLGDLFIEYMERYSKLHKKSWIYDEREIPKFLGHWFKHKLSEIKRLEVLVQHEKIYAKNGLYQANRVLERIRAMYNKAIEWGWEGLNPTAGIKKYREKNRDRFIQPNEMPYIIRAVDEEETDSMKDYFWMLFLTGVRKTNTKMMRWDEINWHRNEWRIPDTKNGDPLIVVIVDKGIEILKRRKETSNSVWVFPQDENNNAHIVNEKRAWNRIRDKATIYLWREDEKISEWIKYAENWARQQYPSGNILNKIKKLAETESVTLPPSLQDIRVHDIRRTFGSYQAITGASLQVIGMSLGHKSTHATQIYARLNLEPVRAAVNKATDAMFSFQTNH
jgi:integrase